MKKFVLLITICILFIPKVYAHPGRIDSFGCHTCRTNCSKWGLANGEYHCHNENSSGSNNNSTTNSNSGYINSSDMPILKSSDNSLKSITIGEKTFYNFYNVIYETSEEHVNIDVVTNSLQATYKIDFPEKLVNGKNKINIRVTAEDGSQREYKVIINKTSDIGDLILELSLLGGGAYGIYKISKNKKSNK